MGALAGKRELMEMIAPSGNVYQAGTFNGNPVSIKAGLAMLKQLDSSFYTTMNSKSQKLRKGLDDVIENNGLNFHVAGLSSMFQIYFKEGDVLDYNDAKSADTKGFTAYFHKLLEGGIFIPPSQFECCFLSKAHSDEDIQITLENVDEALKVVKK